MFPVFFDTPGQLDMRAMTTFGLSAKDNENAIGFFGTGLKYAIAILMRHNATLTVQSNNTTYHFKTQKTEFRNKEFNAITMNDVEMPFTTHLGANWEMWMAYRELYCNTKDEGGIVHTGDKAAGDGILPDGWTRISVTLHEFYTVHRNRHLYFIDDEFPVYKQGFVEVYHGESKCLYYKGIRAYTLQWPAHFRYNFIGAMDLTEDRTLTSTWLMDRRIPQAITHCDNHELIRKFVCAPEYTYERGLSFNDSQEKVSPAFLEVMKPLAHDKTGRVNRTAQALYRALTKEPGEHDYEEIKLTPVQQSQYDRSYVVCCKLGYNPEHAEIVFVKTLGNGMLGCVEDGKIFLAGEVFEQGTKMVAGTLMEELMHFEHNVRDCTRSMQNMLVNKIMTMYETIEGEPL